MKKLEEVFNLPSLKQALADQDDLDEVDNEEDLTDAQVYALIEQVDKIDAALPQVSGLDALDKDYDEIAKKAIDTFEDLIDLGKNVEDRLSADIFNAASNMLANALNAKTNKANKKIEMIKLQIHKARLVHEENKLDYLKQRHLKVEDPTVQETEGHIVSTRNDILNDILAGIRRESEK